jgi:hypothetical protein
MAQKAKTKSMNSSVFRKKARKKRPGVHSKCKQSSHKTGKNYQKKYVGQGK